MTQNPTPHSTPPPPPGPSGGGTAIDPGPAPDPSGGTGATGPRVTSEEMRDLGRLRRSSTHRKVAGVAGGIARHLDVDPLLIRVALVVLVFFGGSGLLLYGGAWLLLPGDDGREAALRLDERSRTVGLAVVGVVAALALVGDAATGPGLLWPIVVVAAVVGVVLVYKERRDGRGAAGRAALPTPSAAPTPGWTPPPVRRDPRRTGPLLFGLTLALIALGLGLLGVVDLAGLDVPGPLYPAAALGLIGVMLIVGAYVGRAGGLILLGLAIVPVMLVTGVATNLDLQQVERRPTTAAAVPLDVEEDAADYTLDLTALPAAELRRLDGREISIRESVGTIEVIVPAGVAVEADAEVEAVGDLIVLGRAASGFNPSVSRSASEDAAATRPGVTTLRLDLRVGVGRITVRQPAPEVQP